MNSMLICRAFCRLLIVGRLLHLKFCWSWLFLHDFDFLGYQGHLKSSQQKVRIKGGLWTGRFWPTPINSPHILKTTSTGEDLHITRLTCDSGVNFRNQYDCWPQWPIQRIQLWSQFLLIWIRTSWKFIHYRMSVSNRWVLSLKIQLLLSIRISQTSTRLSSHFYTAFRLFKHRKMNNFKCV